MLTATETQNAILETAIETGLMILVIGEYKIHHAFHNNVKRLGVAPNLN